MKKINTEYIEHNYPNIQLTNIKKLSYRYATPEEVEEINSIEQAAIKKMVRFMINNPISTSSQETSNMI